MLLMCLAVMKSNMNKKEKMFCVLGLKRSMIYISKKDGDLFDKNSSTVGSKCFYGLFLRLV